MIEQKEFQKRSPNTVEELKKLRNDLMHNQEHQESGPGDLLDLCVFIIDSKQYDWNVVNDNTQKMFVELKKTFAKAVDQLKKENLLENYTAKINTIEQFFKKYHMKFVNSEYVSVMKKPEIQPNQQTPKKTEKSEVKEQSNVSAEIKSITDALKTALNQGPDEIKRSVDDLRVSNHKPFVVYMSLMRSLDNMTSAECDAIEKNYQTILQIIKKTRKTTASFDDDIETIEQFLIENSAYHLDKSENASVSNSLLGLKNYDPAKNNSIQFDCSSYSFFVYCIMSELGHKDIGIADSREQKHAIFVHKKEGSNISYDFSDIVNNKNSKGVQQESEAGWHISQSPLLASSLLMSEYDRSSRSSLYQTYLGLLATKDKCITDLGNETDCYTDNAYIPFLNKLGDLYGTLALSFNKKTISSKDKKDFVILKKLTLDDIHSKIIDKTEQMRFNHQLFARFVTLEESSFK